ASYLTYHIQATLGSNTQIVILGLRENKELQKLTNILLEKFSSEKLSADFDALKELCEVLNRLMYGNMKESCSDSKSESLKGKESEITTSSRIYPTLPSTASYSDNPSDVTVTAFVPSAPPLHALGNRTEVKQEQNDVLPQQDIPSETNYAELMKDEE